MNDALIIFKIVSLAFNTFILVYKAASSDFFLMSAKSSNSTLEINIQFRNKEKSHIQ